MPGCEVSSSRLWPGQDAMAHGFLYAGPGSGGGCGFRLIFMCFAEFANVSQKMRILMKGRRSEQSFAYCLRPGFDIGQTSDHLRDAHLLAGQAQPEFERAASHSGRCRVRTIDNSAPFTLHKVSYRR